MKIHSEILVVTTLFWAAGSIAQQPSPVASPGVPALAQEISTGTNGTGNYSSDVAVVRDAQEQVLQQVRQMLGQSESPEARQALAAAIQHMEKSNALLEEARRSPEKLSAALAAQQAAYQDLLKIVPREFRMSRSQNGAQNNAGQPNRRELDQLDMTDPENRYETERQASAPPDREQNDQLKTADRLKQLARRQQDLNDRLRELQTALQEARTDAQREEIERQLKRLRDEERRMLSDTDELRQDLANAPNRESQGDVQRQLNQTRSDMQRTAEELERQAVSQALAAGTRAQQSLENLKDDVRRQASGRFNEQMRQLRSQARDLARQEDDIARQLQTLTESDHKSLDDSEERRQLNGQLSQQQAALTNLLAHMRMLTEQAETTEPLMSKQLYDLLRRADQMRTDDLLQTSQQLVDRGFLPQAGEAEQTARRNINELRQGVEQAAEGLLGNETEALRYAQKQLDDLTRQVGGELNGLETNAPGRIGQATSSEKGAGTNSFAAAEANSGTPGDQRADRSSQANQTANSQSAGRRGEAQSPSGQRQEGQADGNTAAGNESGPGQNQGDQPGNNSAGGNDSRAAGQNRNGNRNLTAGTDRLRQLIDQLGDGGDGGALTSGPIMGNNFVNWSDRMRDVEDILDAPDLRNQLAAVRERVAALRTEYRQHGRLPDAKVVRTDILTPMAQVRVWLQDELARRENASSLVPLDRDPVPEKYSEPVRHYYEKLGSAQ